MALTTVLCFGDSWTHGNSVALDSHLRTTGHDNVRVLSHDYWGSTAEYFANNTHLLPDAVTNCKADYVLLSMGYGYDFPGDIAGIVTGALWGNAPKDMTTSTKLLLFAYSGMYERLSKDYAKKNNSLTYIPLWGTLQQAATGLSDKKASVRMGYPSLPQFMDDPIHANYLGFSHLLSRLYHSYFKTEFTQPSPPPPSPSSSPSDLPVAIHEVTVSA